LCYHGNFGVTLGAAPDWVNAVAVEVCATEDSVCLLGPASADAAARPHWRQAEPFANAAVN
jgi:hypothetical protein